MSKFKVGDRVRVVEKIEEQNGWKNSWVKDMDLLVNDGKTYIIDNINDSGIYFNIQDDKFMRYGYPELSLELAEDCPCCEELISIPNSEFNINRGTKYQYLTHGDICIAIATTIRANKKGDAIVDWAVSFKNPKDQFNKRIAREAIATRGTKRLVVESGYSRSLIIAKILADLLYNIENLSSDYQWYVTYLLREYTHKVYYEGAVRCLNLK